MKRIAILLSIVALGIAIARVYFLDRSGSHIFQPSWLLVFLLPCGFALLAFITPEKLWVAWCAWLINFLVGGSFLLVCLFYWRPLLLGPYAPLPSSLVQIGLLFIIAPLFNAIALRPWAVSRSPD